MKVPVTENWIVSDKPNSYSITVIIFSSSTCHLPPTHFHFLWTARLTHFMLSNHGVLLFLFILGVLWFGWRRTKCDLHIVLQETLETMPSPSIAFSSFSGRVWRMIFALLNVSSAVTGEAIRPSRPSWPRRAPPRRHVCRRWRRPLGNQSCFLAALSIRNSPEWHLSTVLSVLRCPHTLSPFGFTVTQTLSLLFFHCWVEFFHFSLLVFFPPALSFQDDHRKYRFNTNSPEGFWALVSIYIILDFTSFPSPYFWHLKFRPAMHYDTIKIPVLHLHLYFWPYIWLFLSAH